VTVQELVAELGLKVFSGGDMGRTLAQGYVSDLLSCVMARAQKGDVWVTLQAHPNVVAVASLLNLAAVVVTEDVQPDIETLEKAGENGVSLLGSPQTSFNVVARMSAHGVTGRD
jgi:hypothetical protein